jgi:hypothetical protein
LVGKTFNFDTKLGAFAQQLPHPETGTLSGCSVIWMVMGDGNRSLFLSSTAVSALLRACCGSTG